MRLDVDHDPIGFGDWNDMPVDSLHGVKRIAFGRAGWTVPVVSRIDTWASGEFGPPQGMKYILDSESRALGKRQRKCGVDLREGEAQPVHLPAEQQGILPEGYVRLIPRPWIQETPSMAPHSIK
jgi:hypothetical protein